MRTVPVAFVREEVVYDVVMERCATMARLFHKKIVQRFLKTNNPAYAGLFV